MATKVWQIIEDTTSYSFNASHAVCVALDSLYGAFAKAHHPLEYYTTLLSNYATKGDKDRIALVKEEMRKGFGIRVVPCRFRQDNRSFFLDRVGNTIADALSSVKHISQRVAEALYTMRDKTYLSFVDLLYDMEMHSAFTRTSIEILIRMGYFEEFGVLGKLLAIYLNFRDGSNFFSKAHVASTQEKRLRMLRQEAEALPEIPIRLVDQIRFEIEHYGTVLSTFMIDNGNYAVLDVDDRYSPKVRLHNLKTGVIGVMKMRKGLYQAQRIEQGDVICLQDWEWRQAYEYIAGRSQPKIGVKELWIKRYAKVG